MMTLLLNRSIIFIETFLFKIFFFITFLFITKENTTLFENIKSSFNKTFKINDEFLIFNNPIHQYFITIATLIALFIILFIIKNIFLHNFLKKDSKSHSGLYTTYIIPIVKKTMPFIYYSAFFVSAKNLILPENLNKILVAIWILLLTSSVIKITKHYLIIWFNKKSTTENVRLLNPKIITPIINITLWLLGGIFIIDNLGFKVSSIVASLGIGGIAIAIASQNLLSDLISYISIIFDRPFDIGDFIILENYLGTVEKIGIKTSRIRSLSGELLVIPNTDMVSSRIRNYKRMEQRRVVFTISIAYGTGKEKIISFCNFIKYSIPDIQNTKFDRSHFQSFGDSALIIETVYYVMSADYNVYMDIQQEINLRIYEYCNLNNIEFAFPTQTIHLAK